MSYLVCVFNSFYTIIKTVKIPIPLTTDNVVCIDLFTIIFVFVIFGIIFWFLKELFGFGEYSSIKIGVDKKDGK